MTAAEGLAWLRQYTADMRANHEPRAPIDHLEHSYRIIERREQEKGT